MDKAGISASVHMVVSNNPVWKSGQNENTACKMWIKAECTDLQINDKFKLSLNI